MARYDLGLSWEELAELTPNMFRALCERRNVRLKHDRYANAITAAAVYNVHRVGEATPMVEPFDFVRDAKSCELRAKRQEAKAKIMQAVGIMPTNTTREKFMEIRERVVAGLTAEGRTDAAELWAECWPSLVPEGK